MEVVFYCRGQRPAPFLARPGGPRSRSCCPAHVVFTRTDLLPMETRFLFRRTILLPIEVVYYCHFLARPGPDLVALSTGTHFFLGGPSYFLWRSFTTIAPRIRRESHARAARSGPCMIWSVLPSLDGPFYYRRMTDFEGTARTEHNREDHCVVPSKFVMRR